MGGGVDAEEGADGREGARFKSGVLLAEGLCQITSPFGERIHPITGKRSFHGGIDCALWDGKALVECWIGAWGPGTVAVAHAENDGNAGVHVAVDHGDGLVTKYFHFEEGSLRVKVGDKVDRGTVLGYMGKTGRATGEHLHFQVERDGSPVDPLPYLASRPTDIPAYRPSSLV